MMKKHFALLLILVVLSSCSEDDQGANIYQEHNFTERLSFDHLPERVKTNLKSNYSKKSKTDFGYIDPEQFVFKSKTKSTNTYTMALRSGQKKSIRYFDNLVVQVDGDKSYYYVFRYTPTEEWLTSGKGQGSYSGEVQIFDFNTGRNVGKLEMEDGIEIENLNESKVCQWEFTGEVICAQLYGDGDSYGVEVCNYVYRESCGGGDGTSGGDFGNPSHEGDADPFPTDPAPGGGPGGGFNSGGPGDIETNPIIDDDGDLIEVECLEGEKPNIFGICEEVEEEIINELDGKALCVYNKLTSMSTSFKDAIQIFDGDFPVAHLRFIMEDLGNTRAETRAPDGAGNSPDYVITIALNNNTNTHGVGYRPNLMNAKTIAHEVIHAEMYRKLLSLANQGNLDFTNWSQSEQSNYIKSIKDNFPGLHDYYTRYNWDTNTPNNSQHQQMATHYRETIADVLEYFDSNQHSRQFYMDLAWEGLRYDGTTGNNEIYTWTSMSQPEKDRINEVINDYIEENKNQNCQ